MRMNTRVYLIQSTARVILHISTEFQGDFCRRKELLERTHGSKGPSMSFYTSPLRSKDICLEMKELLEYITKFQGDLSRNKISTEFQVILNIKLVKLVHSKANVILHISIEFLCQFPTNNKVIRMNPWLYLVQSTTQVILHISTEFKGHFF